MLECEKKIVIFSSLLVSRWCIAFKDLVVRIYFPALFQAQHISSCNDLPTLIICLLVSVYATVPRKPGNSAFYKRKQGITLRAISENASSGETCQRGRPLIFRTKTTVYSF